MIDACLNRAVNSAVTAAMEAMEMRANILHRNHIEKNSYLIFFRGATGSLLVNNPTPIEGFREVSHLEVETILRF